MLKSPTRVSSSSAALLAACRLGDLQAVEIQLSHISHALAKAATPSDVRRISLAINASEAAGWTPLLYAARHGWSHIVQQLLAAAPDTPVNSARLGSSGNTALHISSLHGHLEVVRLLLRALQHQQQSQHRPTTTSSTTPASPRSRRLAAAVSSPTATACWGSPAGDSRTADVCPAAAAQAAAAEQQQQSPASPDSVSRIPHAPGTAAAAAGSSSSITSSSRSASVAVTAPASPTSAVNGSSSSGSVHHSGGSNNHVTGVDVRNANGDTALMFAMSSGHMGVAALLLGAGASAAAANAVGITPLLAAAGHGQEGCLLLLQRHVGDDVWQQLLLARDAHGRTALHFAAASGHASIVALLLSPLANSSSSSSSSGIDVWAVSDVGRTALQEAEQSQHKECARLIHERMQQETATAEAAAAALLQEEEAAGSDQQQQQLIGSHSCSSRASRPAAVQIPGAAAAAVLHGPQVQQQQQQQQQQHSKQSLEQQSVLRATSPVGANRQGMLQRQGVTRPATTVVVPAAAAATPSGLPRPLSPSRIPSPPAGQKHAAAATAAKTHNSSDSNKSCSNGKDPNPIAGASVADDDQDTGNWIAVVSGRKGRSKSNIGSGPAAAAGHRAGAAAKSAASDCKDLEEVANSGSRSVAAAHGLGTARLSAAAAIVGASSHAEGDIKQQPLTQKSPLRAASPVQLPAAAAVEANATPTWWDTALLEMSVAAPAAAALDIQPQHVLGVGVDQLSMSQLDCLELVHRAALSRISEVRIQLANRQHAEEAQEQQKLKQEIAELVQRVKQRS